MRISKATTLACLPLLAFLILSGCASTLPGDTGPAASATTSRGTSASSAYHETGEDIPQSVVHIFYNLDENDTCKFFRKYLIPL